MTDNSRQTGPIERQPAIFIPHGGGPCFFMDWPDVWDRMAEHLRGVAATLPQRPAALVVMSGHWETDRVTVTTGTHPQLIYDYYGFPAHTYELQYPAPGSPKLAEYIQKLLAKAGIASGGDAYRGFDHGVFIPLMLAFEKADIPVVEISLPLNATAEDVMEIGRALAPLRDENVLLVGAGMTYHNLRRFLRPGAEADEQSRHFDDWLYRSVSEEPDQRSSRLAQWAEAPFAQDCHPKAEHLLPLMFVAGAAGTDPGVRDYNDTVMGKALSGFRFG